MGTLWGEPGLSGEVPTGAAPALPAAPPGSGWIPGPPVLIAVGRYSRSSSLHRDVRLDPCAVRTEPNLEFRILAANELEDDQRLAVRRKIVGRGEEAGIAKGHQRIAVLRVAEQDMDTGSLFRTL